MHRKRWTANLPRLARTAHGTPSVPVVLFYVPAFLAGAASVCLTAGIDRWHVAPFLVLGAFPCLSTLTDVMRASRR